MTAPDTERMFSSWLENKHGDSVGLGLSKHADHDHSDTGFLSIWIEKISVNYVSYHIKVWS